MINLNKLGSILFLALSLAGSSCFIGYPFTATSAVARTPEETTANRVYAKSKSRSSLPSEIIADMGVDLSSSADGYVITNAHVVKGQPAVVTVMMADGKTEMPADVVGFCDWRCRFWHC